MCTDPSNTEIPTSTPRLTRKGKPSWEELFKAHTAELLPAGDYKLVVKSCAGDAAGPLQTSFRKVKYLRVVDPEPVWPEVRLVSVNGGEDVYEDSSGCSIEGENLTILDGDTITAEAEFEGRHMTIDVAVDTGESSESLLELTYDTDVFEGMAGGSVTFTVRSRGDVAEAPFQTHSITANIGTSG